jgi:hypothetical protein
MKLLSVEIKLLLAIHAGQSVVKGEDVHTLRQLIAKGKQLLIGAIRSWHTECSNRPSRRSTFFSLVSTIDR